MTLYITNTVCKQFFKDPSISLLVIKILFEKKNWVKTLSVHLFVINLMFDWADVNCSKQKNSRNRNWKTSCCIVYILNLVFAKHKQNLPPFVLLYLWHNMIFISLLFLNLYNYLFIICIYFDIGLQLKLSYTLFFWAIIHLSSARTSINKTDLNLTYSLFKTCKWINLWLIQLQTEYIRPENFSVFT